MSAFGLPEGAELRSPQADGLQVVAPPTAPFLFYWLTLTKTDNVRAVSWRLPAIWSGPIALLLVGEVVLGSPIWRAGRLLALACAWFAVVGAWMAWRKLLNEWPTIASGFVDGGRWLSGEFERMSLGGSLLGAQFAFVVALLGTAGLGLFRSVSAPSAPTPVVGYAIYALAVVALAPVAIGVFWSLRALVLASKLRASEFILTPGSELESPGIVAMARFARAEAYLGAVLFMLLSLPITLFLREAPIPVQAAWAALLLVPFSAVLTAGVLLPRWLARPAIERIQTVSALMRRRIDELWLKADAEIHDCLSGREVQDAMLRNTEAVATVYLAYATTPQHLTDRGRDLRLSLASSPIVLQALALLA